MNIATVLGSPRKKGNTSKVLGWVEEALEARGHRVERINVVDHKVNGCKGCWTCKKFTDKSGCPQKDDAVGILGRLMDSDMVLYASPVYFWGPTAQIKALIDRHCSLVAGYATPRWQSLMDGKKIGLVVTCEDAEENNTEMLVETFKKLADYLKCDYRGTLVVPFTTTPDALGDEIRQGAAVYAHRIAGGI
jgi:multimeric flavodoxin WrbA